MKLSRLFGLVALPLACLSLGSCAAIKTDLSAASAAYSAVTTATVTQAKAKALHDAIAATEVASDTYLEEPNCTATTPATTACKGLTTSVKVAKALQVLRSADDSLTNSIVAAQTAGTGVGVASAGYNLAVSAYNAYLAAYTAAKSSATASS